jgi:hypothetical protein
MQSPAHELLLDWFAQLERRHLAELKFSEVRRAVQALSARYVERRGMSRASGALRGAGKRAAFALYFGPLHFLTVLSVVERLDITEPPRRIIDLGCGTGAAAAAWASSSSKVPRLLGIDHSAWAVGETRWTWQRLGLAGQVRRGNLVRFPEPRGGEAILLAYTINELGDDDRRTLRERLLGIAARNSSILVIEPIARRISPWWAEWVAAFEPFGGRANEWRFRVRLPERLELLDRAAGLDHRELTARSLFIPVS